MDRDYTVVLVFEAGIVDDLTPLPSQEELHSVGREIVLESLPYVRGTALRDFLLDYQVSGLTIELSLLLPRSLLGEVVDALTSNYEEGPDTWMEGDISLGGEAERDLAIALSSLTIQEGSALQWQ